MKIIQIYRNKKNEFLVNIEHVDENRREMIKCISREFAESLQRKEARRFRKSGHKVFCDDFTAFMSDL